LTATWAECVDVEPSTLIDRSQSIAARSTFPARVAEGAASVAIDVHELAVLLEGIEVDELKTKPRWEPTPAPRSTLI